MFLVSIAQAQVLTMNCSMREEGRKKVVKRTLVNTEIDLMRLQDVPHRTFL